MSCRLFIIANHLTSKFPLGSFDDSLEVWRKKASHINQKVVNEEFLGPNHEKMNLIRKFVSDSELFDYHEDLRLSTEQLREKVMKQLSVVTKAFPLTKAEDQAHPNLKICIMYGLAEYDLGAATRLIVSLVLYLDAILSFGTEKHEEIINRTYKLQDFGCFAMTELGHGSNVAGVETTATYIKETRQFELHTPTRTAAKWWIGAAGKTANMAVILAQLIVEGQNHGVHMFVVPIRGPKNESIDGVILGDCGPKISLHGVDNGFILFTNYKVSYDSLLDKISHITPEGKYKSTIKNKEKRLGIMIGALIRGRNCVVVSGSLSLAFSLTCALRYSAVRKQFSPSGQEEVSILSYQGQKVRLIPILAQCFAARCANHIVQELIEKNSKLFAEHPEGEELAEFHAILSVLKALSSSYGLIGSQICRESCGGHGYSAFSSIGRIRDEQEVQVTWEGDNMVLIQQTSKYLLKQVQKSMKGHHIYSDTLRFLKMGHEDKKRGRIEGAKSTVEAMEAVVNFYLNESMMKLQEMAALGGTMTEIWNKCQSFYLQELARSYGELLMIKEFQKLVEKITARDQVTGASISKLHEIYSITVLERHFSILIELGYSISHRKEFKDKLIKLCEEAGEECIGIIDSIAPHDKILSSSIGSYDGQIYSRIIQLTESWPEVYDQPFWLPTLLEIRGVNK